MNDWINDWLRCVGNSLWQFLNGPFGQAIGGFIVIFLVGLIVVGTMAAISGEWELVVGYIGAMLFAAMLFFGILFCYGLLNIIIQCTIAVIQRSLDAGAPGAATVVGALLAAGSVTTCQSARALLTQAQAALAAAQAARDAQAQRVDAARTRVRNATTILFAAAASAAAAIWQPWTLVAALAALVAAVALLARRTRELANELAALGLREADLLRALADVAAAETLVATLCGTSPTATSGEDAGLLGRGRVPVLTTPP